METFQTCNSRPADYYDSERPDISALVPPHAYRILDIGCGTGRLGDALKRRAPCHITGLEQESEPAAIACQRLDDVFVADVETFDLPFPLGSFDCIICGDVLEHLRDPWTLLARLRSLLQPEGALIASVPNLATSHAGRRVSTKLLTFFCTLIPRRTLAQIGLLDEDFFLNHEDFEYSLRVTRAGLDLAVAADVFVYHKGGNSKDSLAAPDRRRHDLESAQLLHRKLERLYGVGRVPSAADLWGFDLFLLDPHGQPRDPALSAALAASRP